MVHVVMAPLLGPCALGSCKLDVEIRRDERSVRIKHERQLGDCTCETVLEVELPAGVRVPERVSLVRTMDCRSKNAGVLQVVHANPMELHVVHELRERWHDARVALCHAADIGDDDAWNSAWVALEDVCVEAEDKKNTVGCLSGALGDATDLPADIADAIVRRAIIGNVGWTRGAAQAVLFHAHAAVDRCVPGALTRLSKIVHDGGLERSDVIVACSEGLMRSRHNEEVDEDGVWVKTGMAGPSIRIHKIVADRFSIDESTRDIQVYTYDDLPVIYDNTFKVSEHLRPLKNAILAMMKSAA